MIKLIGWAGVAIAMLGATGFDATLFAAQQDHSDDPQLKKWRWEEHDGHHCRWWLVKGGTRSTPRRTPVEKTQEYNLGTADCVKSCTTQGRHLHAAECQEGEGGCFQHRDAPAEASISQDKQKNWLNTLGIEVGTTIGFGALGGGPKWELEIKGKYERQWGGVEGTAIGLSKTIQPLHAEKCSKTTVPVVGYVGATGSVDVIEEEQEYYYLTDIRFPRLRQCVHQLDARAADFFWEAIDANVKVSVMPSINIEGREKERLDEGTCGCEPPAESMIQDQGRAPRSRVQPVSEPVYTVLEQIGHDHFAASEIKIPIEDGQPVFVDFVGSESDDPFGWGNGMTFVEDGAKDGVVAEPPADEAQPALLQIDPKRTEKVTVTSKPELGRIFNLMFDSATKPQKRLRLRDPGDESGTKEPVKLQTGQTPGATTYQTPTLALEVDDSNNGPYTLTHNEVGKVADFTPALRVRQGDRTTQIGNFTGITKEGRSALGSASASDLNLVDAKGKSTSLSEIASGVETGLARPTVNAPAKASPGEEVTIDVTGDFAHASRVSGLPRSAIVMEVNVDGAFHHIATSEQDSFNVNAPQSGVINVTARYKGDSARLADANKAANASVNDLERTAPESTAKWFRSAYDGRSELYRTTKPK